MAREMVEYNESRDKKIIFPLSTRQTETQNKCNTKYHDNDDRTRQN